MPAVALHGIRLNVTNIDLATQFYMSLGMVEDIGMRRVSADGAPTSILADNDPSGPAIRSLSLRWPSDPHMHLNLVALQADAPVSGFPKAAGQFGSTVLTILVSDLAAELQRLRGGGAVTGESATTERLLGPTQSAFVQDPDGNIVELIEAHPGWAWNYSRCSPFGADRTFLHAELNTDSFKAVAAFYEGFGFAHNHLDDVRPNPNRVTLAEDPFEAVWGAPISRLQNGLGFYRLPDEQSEMHLEVMGLVGDALQDPTPDTVWQQRGLMRFCFKTGNLAAVLADLKRRGTHIFMQDQKAGFGWGDSEWFFFADPDGNILTFEEWFPAGHWGERY
jgi:catechol 2,3-dioxygenase-like lactoylglutathione lyase family enzyme